MSDMRRLLEDIKTIVDEIYRRVPAQWYGAKEMVLFPPASVAEINRFLNSLEAKGLPPSYREFLQASDGIELGWNRLSFLGTVKSRREPILKTVNDVIVRHEGSFVNFQGEINDKNIEEWESNPKRLFLRRHPIVAANTHGRMLVYDSKTHTPDGEMVLCDWSLATDIRGRYPHLRSYFETALQEAQEYLAKKAPKRAGKAT